MKPSLFFGYQLQEWNEHRYAIAGPEKTLIDYLYLHHEVKEIADIEALRWNVAKINTRISMKTLNSYEAYINSPALSRRLNTLKTYLNAAT